MLLHCYTLTQCVQLHKLYFHLFHSTNRQKYEEKKKLLTSLWAFILRHQNLRIYNKVLTIHSRIFIMLFRFPRDIWVMKCASRYNYDTHNIVGDSQIHILFYFSSTEFIFFIAFLAFEVFSIMITNVDNKTNLSSD